MSAAGRVMAAAVALLGAWPAPAAPAPAFLSGRAPSEYQVKAAFLYHFAQLVEWPAGKGGAIAPPFDIGLLGDDVFAGALERAIDGKTVHQRRLRFRRYEDLEAVRKSPPQVLFVALSDARAAQQVLQALADAPVLTVSDLEGFADQGGMIGFRITPEGRVGFDINHGRVQRAGLRMSSQLLKLARIVGRP
ncbi:MAG TPA: YfiR family protein [Vicinamibacteria bacterium]|nr:YfiR family protein [Vicinamibacteria bacterium]